MKKKILCLTSVIGGGHVYRDLAIGRALLERVGDDHELVYASGGAAYEMLAREGVTVERIEGLDFPSSAGSVPFLDLYFEVMRSEWHQAFDLSRLIREHEPVLVILDEMFFLTDLCRAKDTPVVFMSDFVGVPHSPWRDGVVRAGLERFFDWFLSSWLTRRADRWIFIGDRRAIPSESWRTRADERGIVSVEPITRMQYTPPPHRAEARAKLGHGEQAQVVTAAVGCSGTGRYLLDAMNAAAAQLSEKMPGLQVELICGLGIDPAQVVPSCSAVRVHGYVRDFEVFLAASDAAVLQCGLTTTTEALMCGVPMLPVSLVGHWEQEQTARFLREAHDTPSIRADEASPMRLASELQALLARARRPSPYQGDGHLRAADAIAALLA